MKITHELFGTLDTENPADADTLEFLGLRYSPHHLEGQFPDPLQMMVQIQQLKQENARLREALIVFAEPMNWIHDPEYSSFEWSGEEYDPRWLARAALGEGE